MIYRHIRDSTEIVDFTSFHGSEIGGIGGRSGQREMSVKYGESGRNRRRGEGGLRSQMHERCNWAVEFG